jgi:hypothetical protein
MTLRVAAVAVRVIVAVMVMRMRMVLRGWMMKDTGARVVHLVGLARVGFSGGECMVVAVDGGVG